MDMFKDFLQFAVKGHCKITDQFGNVLLDKNNAVHPENLARVFCRALCDENNYIIRRMAFGNGGSTTNAASVTTLLPPNDGQPPDIHTWDSRLYHEIYSEIIDTGNAVINPQLGVDPGDADSNTGFRPGGDSVPSADPVPTLHVSGPGIRSVELGLTSQIIATCVVNSQEPTFATPTSPFIFDEIGLYSYGLQALSSPGYNDVSVGNKNSTNPTNLQIGVTYTFKIAVDGGTLVTISLTPPVNTPTFGQLCQAINTGDVTWNPMWAGINPLPNGATVSITDTSGLYSTIIGAVTDGNLRFTSASVGTLSSIVIQNGTSNNIFATNVLSPSVTSVILTPVPGANAGVQNAPTNPSTERERLLAHLTFDPITQGQGVTLTIVYTITVSIARTPQVSP